MGTSLLLVASESPTGWPWQDGCHRHSLRCPPLTCAASPPAQLAAASQIFHDHKQLPMLPVNQIDEDENRAELDRRLLTEVLGLPGALCESADSPLALLRRKLAAEPSIHGGKN